MTSLLVVSLFGLRLAAAPAPSPAARTCSLHVSVTDEDGAPINKAFALIHSDRGAKVSQQPVLDASGKFRLNLRPNLYSLFISSAGFVPVAQILDLRACKPVNINLMLTIDTEHMENDND